jgi:hypothetical protein
MAQSKFFLACWCYNLCQLIVKVMRRKRRDKYGLYGANNAPKP